MLILIVLAHTCALNAGLRRVDTASSHYVRDANDTHESACAWRSRPKRAQRPRLVVRRDCPMALHRPAIGVAGAMALSRTVQGLLFGGDGDRSATFAAVIANAARRRAVACLRSAPGERLEWICRHGVRSSER